MKSRIKELFIKHIIRFLNIIIPKNTKQIYLRSHYEYRDNIHAILDELLRAQKCDFKIVGDGDVFREYIKDGVEYVQPSSFRAILLFLRSKYVFNDGGMFYNTVPVKNQIIVNTWHGVSLKKIGYYLDGYNGNSGLPTATYIVTYSDFFKATMSKAFGVPKDNVLLTGEPRNDYFFNPVSKDPFASIGVNAADYKKIIIWMPTYRQNYVDSTSDGAEYDFGIPLLNYSNLQDFNQFCKKTNTLVLIKWHGLQCVDNNMTDKLSNVRFLTSLEVGKAKISLNEIVGRCDALITDYSSVYVNYLVLNRPICFAYDDIDEYKKNRGFMFDDVENIMPGTHTHNMDGLKSFILNCCNGIDEYREDRIKVNMILNKYSDGKNSYRLLNALGIIK